MTLRCVGYLRLERPVAVPQQDGDRVVLCICNCDVQGAVVVEVAHRDSHGNVSRPIGHRLLECSIPIPQQDGNGTIPLVRCSQVLLAVVVEITDSNKLRRGASPECRLWCKGERRSERWAKRRRVDIDHAHLIICGQRHVETVAKEE